MILTRDSLVILSRDSLVALSNVSRYQMLVTPDRVIDRRIALSRKRFKNCVLRVFPLWAKAVNCVKTQIGIDLRYIARGPPTPSVMLLAQLTKVGRPTLPACVRVRVCACVRTHFCMNTTRH